MNDPWPVIRSATGMDAEPVLELMAELGYPELSRARFLETYREVLENPNMFLLVAEDEDHRLIALASLTSRPQLRLAGRLVNIDELVVADRVRGLGVGGRILAAAQGMARQLGARRLELETNRARESYRRRFYVKNGFLEADSALMRIDYEFDSDSE